MRRGQPDGRVVLSQIAKPQKRGEKKQYCLLTREMHALAEKLEMPLTNASLWASDYQPQAATALTFVWNMGAKAKDAAADIDELLYELFPETKQPVENMA